MKITRFQLVTSEFLQEEDNNSLDKLMENIHL